MAAVVATKSAAVVPSHMSIPQQLQVAITEFNASFTTNDNAIGVCADLCTLPDAALLRIQEPDAPLWQCLNQFLDALVHFVELAIGPVQTLVNDVVGQLSTIALAIATDPPNVSQAIAGVVAIIHAVKTAIEALGAPEVQEALNALGEAAENVITALQHAVGNLSAVATETFARQLQEDQPQLSIEAARDQAQRIV